MLNKKMRGNLTINRSTRRDFVNTVKTKGRRKLKKIMLSLCALILGFTIVSNMFSCHGKDKRIDPKTEYTQDTDYYTAKAQYDENKAKLELDIKNAQKFVAAVSDEINFASYTEEGNYATTHETKNKHFLGLYKSNSEAKVYFDYKALYGIDGADVRVSNDGTNVIIDFDIDKMKVLAIDSSEPVITTDKDWLGHEYTNQEALTIMDAAKDKLIEQINSDELIRTTAEENLVEYFKELAESFGIKNLTINDDVLLSKYEYMSPEKIKYNVPNKSLEEVKYIVIHSTDVQNKDAWGFYQSLSSGETERGTSAHCFVDDNFVIQCVPFTDQAYHCGGDNQSGINNDNSIGIEICEYKEEDRQLNAIKNAISYVKDVKKQYPEAKVVMHREVKATACPHIMTNEEFEKWFR